MANKEIILKDGADNVYPQAKSIMGKLWFVEYFSIEGQSTKTLTLPSGVYMLVNGHIHDGAGVSILVILNEYSPKFVEIGGSNNYTVSGSSNSVTFTGKYDYTNLRMTIYRIGDTH